jgi:hypothetical protein
MAFSVNGRLQPSQGRAVFGELVQEPFDPLREARKAV